MICRQAQVSRKMQPVGSIDDGIADPQTSLDSNHFVEGSNRCQDAQDIGNNAAYECAFPYDWCLLLCSCRFKRSGGRGRLSCLYKYDFFHHMILFPFSLVLLLVCRYVFAWEGL